MGAREHRNRGSLVDGVMVCDCHREPMYRVPNTKTEQWVCWVRKRQLARESRERMYLQRGVTPPPCDPPPLCECHGTPMRWKTQPALREGGAWRCRKEQLRHGRTYAGTFKYQLARGRQEKKARLARIAEYQEMRDLERLRESRVL